MLEVEVSRLPTSGITRFRRLALPRRVSGKMTRPCSHASIVSSAVSLDLFAVSTKDAEIKVPSIENLDLSRTLLNKSGVGHIG